MTNMSALSMASEYIGRWVYSLRAPTPQRAVEIDSGRVLLVTWEALFAPSEPWPAALLDTDGVRRVTVDLSGMTDTLHTGHVGVIKRFCQALAERGAPRPILIGASAEHKAVLHVLGLLSTFQLGCETAANSSALCRRACKDRTAETTPQNDAERRRGFYAPNAVSRGI